MPCDPPFARIDSRVSKSRARFRNAQAACTALSSASRLSPVGSSTSVGSPPTTVSPYCGANSPLVYAPRIRSRASRCPVVCLHGLSCLWPSFVTKRASTPGFASTNARSASPSWSHGSRPSLPPAAARPGKNILPNGVPWRFCGLSDPASTSVARRCSFVGPAASPGTCPSSASNPFFPRLRAWRTYSRHAGGQPTSPTNRGSPNGKSMPAIQDPGRRNTAAPGRPLLGWAGARPGSGGERRRQAKHERRSDHQPVRGRDR